VGGYEALFRVLWPNAYRIAWSILGERGAAEDAAQAACAAICAKLSTLSDTRAFVGWAYRIIVSHARDQARARRRLQLRETLGYDDATIGPARDDPSVRLDLETAISRLPEPLRFRLMMARRRLRPLLCDSTASPATLEVTSRTTMPCSFELPSIAGLRGWPFRRGPRGPGTPRRRSR
jgi:RNA polymerase sigma factor (sigma-70 family)